MKVHLHLSRSAFVRMIKIRLLGEFRPIDETSRFKGIACYMDGLDISTVDLVRSPRDRAFALNNLSAGGAVAAVTVDNAYKPLTVKLNGALLLSPASSVRAAAAPQADARYGLPDRPDDLRVPLLNVEFDVFFSVSPAGIPTLNVSMAKGPDGIEAFPDAAAFISKFQSLNLPFPVGDAFGDVLMPGRTKVLNAGIALAGEDVVMRLEFEPEPADPSANAQRLGSWLGFFAGGQPSALGGRDWALELPTSELASRAAKGFDESFSDPDVKKHFTSSGAAWASFEPGYPGLHLHKEGVAESACAGLDIRATIEADATLSVPAPDTLRMSVETDIDIDDWDSFKCIVVSLINPFAGLITTVDQDLPWWAVFPVSIFLPLAPIAFGFGVDDLLVKEAIKSAQDAAKKKGGPTIVRTSANTFYVDVQKSIRTSFTRDWARLDAVAGAGDRLILSGAFLAPDVRTLPRLRGRLVDGFEFWSKKDRCSSNTKWVTNATISLGLEDENGQPVHPPLVPLVYGIDIETVDGKPAEVGGATWRIIEDPEKVYGGTPGRVHWTGIPGVFEVEVMQPPPPYRSQPYDFRMQIFTSAGVREFQIPAPPPVPKAPQTPAEQIAEAAERISSCYIFSTLLTRVKALQVHWLPTPQPQLEVAQHWQVAIAGLSPEDRIRAWNADSGELLAEVRAFEGGVAEVSLVVPAEQAMRTLQLTLNDAPLLEGEVYARRAGQVEGCEIPGENPVSIRQTPLYPVATVDLDGRADVIVPQRRADRLRLLAQAGGEREVRQVELDLGDPRRVIGRSRLAAAERLQPQVPAAAMMLAQVTHEAAAVRELVTRTLPGERNVLARYYGRPWYDRGGVSGGFYAQLDDGGAQATVYRRGFTRDVAPDVGARRPATLAAVT